MVALDHLNANIFKELQTEWQWNSQECSLDPCGCGRAGLGSMTGRKRVIRRNKTALRYACLERPPRYFYVVCFGVLLQ